MLDLVRTVKGVTDITKQRRGFPIHCGSCLQEISYPPALIDPSSETGYHLKCAMEVVYNILYALSGYSPNIIKKPEEGQPEELSKIAEAFRTAAAARKDSGSHETGSST